MADMNQTSGSTPTPDPAPATPAEQAAEAGAQSRDESRRGFLSRVGQALGWKSLGDAHPAAAEVKAQAEAEAQRAAQARKAEQEPSSEPQIQRESDPSGPTADEIKALKAEIAELKAKNEDPAPEVPIVEERELSPWELAAQRTYGDDVDPDQLSRVANLLERKAQYAQAIDTVGDEQKPQYQRAIQGIENELRLETRAIEQDRQVRELRAELASLKEGPKEVYNPAPDAERVIGLITTDAPEGDLAEFVGRLPNVRHALGDEQMRAKIQDRLTRIDAEDQSQYLAAAEALLLDLEPFLPSAPEPEPETAPARGVSVRPPRGPSALDDGPPQLTDRDQNRRAFMEKFRARA